MSSALTLTSDELKALGGFLEDLTAATNRSGWFIGAHITTQIALLDNDSSVLTVEWQPVENRYVVADRVGS